MFLIQNIINNYTFVKNDFITWSLNPQIFLHFFLSFLIASLLMILFYVVGKKIRKAFFKETKKYTFYIDILLGYVIAGSGIGLLGMLSLFKPELIIGYLLVLFLIGMYPFAFAEVKEQSAIGIKQLKKNIFKRHDFIEYGVALFIIITFLRLFTPEIGEDGYHTDLPRQYLSWQTTIHESREVQHVLSYPQLPEMIYTVPIIYGEKEAVRFIHFSFYLLIILLLFEIAREKKYYFAKFAPLIFVTAPAAVRYAPTQFTDFFAIFPFLLSVLLIKKDMSIKSVILAGICFGAVVSAKIWMLVYLPLLLLYLLLLNKHLQKKQLFKMIAIFVASYLLISLMWYIRTIIIMGSPIYPILNTKETLDIYPLPRIPLSGYFGLNWYMFTLPNMIVLSPLLFLGFIFSLLHFRKVYKIVGSSPLFLFALLFTLEQLIAKVGWGRYLLTWAIFVSLIVSSGLLIMYKKYILARVVVVSLFLILFSYYAINTLFLLPYGLGIADKNSFLSRTLLRQNGNHYDYGRLFEKRISKDDLVGTYGVVNFYYADFAYIDVGYIFDKKNRSFDLLKKAKVKKLLIYGGDMKWFCKKLSLIHCDEKKYKRLATYPQGWEVYNLYEIK